MTSINSKNKQNNMEDELNLRFILNLILRNKIFIAIFTSSIFLFSCFYALSKKRIYEGNFQIVLRKEQLSLRGNNLLEIYGNRNAGLETEVSILESPSILMPIFDFVNEEKKKIYPEFTPPLFSDWRSKSLNIKLKERTKVLNIVYQDEDSSIIVPVLNQISEAYQVYSLRSTKRNLELSQLFLNQKISEYKSKTTNSLKKLQEFATKEDLAIYNYRPLLNNFRPNINLNDFQDKSDASLNLFNPMGDNINVEIKSTQAANRIREIDAQLEQLKSTKDLSELKYIISDDAAEVKKLIPPIDNLNLEIMVLETKYQINDPLLIEKKQKRDLMLANLKDYKIGFLKNARQYAQSQIAAAKRPKGVLLEYKKLLRDAKREESTLLELENKSILLDLEKSKIQDPWELITESNLIPYPVAPSRTRIGLIGIFIGSLLSILISYIRERISDIIYESEDIESLTNAKILDKLNLNTNQFKKYTNFVFLNEILGSFKKRRFAIIKSNEISKQNCKTIFEKILEDNFKYIILENFQEAHEDDVILLIVKIGSITKKDLNQFVNRLNMLNKKIDYVLLTEK